MSQIVQSISYIPCTWKCLKYAAFSQFVWVIVISVYLFSVLFFFFVNGFLIFVSTMFQIIYFKVTSKAST